MGGIIHRSFFFFLDLSVERNINLIPSANRPGGRSNIFPLNRLPLQYHVLKTSWQRLKGGETAIPLALLVIDTANSSVLEQGGAGAWKR